MAKKTAKPPTPTCVEVNYDLGDLPSAQHKAGLAGLLLQVENMVERRNADQLPSDHAIPEVEFTARTAKVRFTEQSIRNLFDDLYAAETLEVKSKTKWQNVAELRQELNPNPKPDEPKRWFIYETVQPSGNFLRQYTDNGKDAWHKLWRDMIYAVPRNKPTTRQAYKNRAEHQPTREGIESWKSLLALEKARSKGTLPTVELAGSLMLAVQAVTAEAVSFEDRVETQLLLHFWVLVARIFVPQQVDSDGKSDFVGYALAIPEVEDLDRYCNSFKKLLEKLDSKKNLFRPAGAVIVLPEQGPLEFLHNLDRLAAENVLADRPATYVAGIEFFHMVVAGNNVKLRAHGRIPVEEAMLEDYSAYRRDFHNFQMLTGLLLAMLRHQPWFAELDGPIHKREWSQLVHCTQDRRRTPPAMLGFAWEVDKQFQSLSVSLRSVFPQENTVVSNTESPDAVDAIVYDLVRVYVRERACARAGVKPDDKDWWSKTADERRDVCAKLFLEFRSRHGEEFVSYFSDTIASVAQWLDESRYLKVARALMSPVSPHDGPDRPRSRDDIKTLTMLALAAHSRSIKTRDAADISNPSTTNAPEASE